MSPRLITVIIFLFCGTMTGLLVRSVLFPENSGLADVPPNVPFDFFVARTEGSTLDIWDANKIIGVCHIVPSNSASGPKVHLEKVKVKVDVTLRFPRELMGSSLVGFNADLWLHSNGNMEFTTDEENGGPPFEIVLYGSNPQIRLTVNQPAGDKPPSLKLLRGGLTLFESSTGLNPGDTNSQMISAMLQTAGLPPDTLAAKEKEEKSTTTVRAGHIEAGGETFDGYLLSTGADEDSRFSLYISNTGEILRVHTPLSGKNDLGLRMLSENLIPKGVERPDLNKWQKN
jgi:hypothetical protein